MAVLATTTYAQDNKTLEQRVEELELSRDLNWIKWGGSLETRYDYLSSSRDKDYTTTNPTTGSPQTLTKGGDNDAYFRLWANLNMEATPNDRLSFFGRLSAAKYFTVLGQNGNPQGAFSDLSDGQTPESSALYLERAFANYKITPTLVFTMGRLPTIDGPNKHIALNQQLSGNYPTLAYSAILDGFALTKTFPMTESNSVFRAKAIYTPVSTPNYSGFTQNGTQNLRDARGNRLRTSSDFYSFLGEYEKTNASWFKRNLTIFQWLHGEQNPFYQTPRNNVPLPPPFPGGSTINTNGDLRVTVDRFVLYTEFEKIFNSEFDFAAQGMYSMTRSRGDLITCSGPLCATPGAGLNNVQGWNTNKRSDDLYGYATALTLRYQTPFRFLNRPKVGVEYFRASKEAYVYDAANINPINMYATQNGDVWHAFYNQQFDGGLAMNVGYFYRKQKMTRELFGIFGDEVKTDNIDQNLYISLLATF